MTEIQPIELLHQFFHHFQLEVPVLTPYSPRSIIQLRIHLCQHPLAPLCPIQVPLPPPLLQPHRCLPCEHKSSPDRRCESDLPRVQGERIASAEQVQVREFSTQRAHFLQVLTGLLDPDEVGQSPPAASEEFNWTYIYIILGRLMLVNEWIELGLQGDVM